MNEEQKIITRKEAKEQGLKLYFTGKPCKRGHLEYRHVSGGCMECNRQRAREYRKENYDKVIKQDREYREKNKDELNKKGRERYAIKKLNPEFVDNERARMRELYKKHRESRLANQRKYYESNKEKERDRHKKYREENRDILLLREKKRRSEHREEIKRDMKKFQRSEKGTKASLRCSLGCEPPKELVKSVHTNRQIKRIIREQKQSK